MLKFILILLHFLKRAKETGLSVLRIALCRMPESLDFRGNIKISVLFCSWKRFEKYLFSQNENSRIKSELLNTAFQLHARCPFCLE